MMHNFDLRKYLAEGRIHLNENLYTATYDNDFGTFIDDLAHVVGSDNNVEMGPVPITLTPNHFSAWDEFGYDKYWNHIPEDQPFKITGDTEGLAAYPSLKNYTFVKNGNVIKGEAIEGQQLNENAPGYDTRKFGEALPTLESVQAAYEDKEEPRDGVKSAAEKLGMKPSHVKEDSFSGAEIDPNVELYSNDAVDWNFEESIEKIIDELKEYQKVNPQDDLQTAINHLEYLIYA